MLHMFVYGTLLRGESNAAVAAPFVKTAVPGAVIGNLYDAGGYPGLVPDEGGRPIEGEWLELEDEALPVLDALEEYRGPDQINDYERVWVTDADGSRSGWTYVWKDGRGCPRIESGSWKRHRRPRQSLPQKRLVIAGISSGSGKTTVTIGLMAALKLRGLEVQGFKCGPDYIDPTYHTAITGRPSRNLDSWMLGAETVKAIYARGARDADISVIEGVMGFYDGKCPTSDEGSTAEISRLLQSPVVLVIHCGSMARSAAAVVRGFQALSRGASIVGVIVNKVAGAGHYELVRKAVEQECGIPTLGYLQRDEEIMIPERHLGLIPSVERGELQPLFDRLAETVEQTIDVDRLLALADAPLVESAVPLFPPSETDGERKEKVIIAVARDAAFHFYYPENVELLEAHGAVCTYFSPVAGEPVPEEADGVYIGGGFPEEFAAQLADGERVKASVRAAAEAGKPIVAECGGYMYLAERLMTKDGQVYPMVGLVPGTVAMQNRLQSFGYREVQGREGNFLIGPEDVCRGHEFHYSAMTPHETWPPAYTVSGMRGEGPEGYARGSVVAGYTHLHFASNPVLVRNWLRRCREFKERSPVDGAPAL